MPLIHCYMINAIGSNAIYGLRSPAQPFAFTFALNLPTHECNGHQTKLKLSAPECCGNVAKAGRFFLLCWQPVLRLCYAFFNQFEFCVLQLTMSQQSEKAEGRAHWTNAEVPVLIQLWKERINNLHGQKCNVRCTAR